MNILLPVAIALAFFALLVLALLALVVVTIRGHIREGIKARQRRLTQMRLCIDEIKSQCPFTVQSFEPVRGGRYAIVTLVSEKGFMPNERVPVDRNGWENVREGNLVHFQVTDEYPYDPSDVWDLLRAVPVVATVNAG